MESRWTNRVCIISTASMNYKNLVKDITVNCLRNGATVQTYTVPNTDNSAAGSYTCMVTVSTAASSESPSHTLTATGSLAFETMQANLVKTLLE